MNEQRKNSFRQIVGESIGEASMCWSETPSGIFDSSRATRILGDILKPVKLLEEQLNEANEIIKKFTVADMWGVCECQGCRYLKNYDLYPRSDDSDGSKST